MIKFKIRKDGPAPITAHLEIDNEGDCNIWLNDRIVAWISCETGKIHRLAADEGEEIPGIAYDEDGLIAVSD